MCLCGEECFLKGYNTIPKSAWKAQSPIFMSIGCRWGTKDDPDKEMIAEWVEVAKTKSYCPCKEEPRLMT